MAAWARAGKRHVYQVTYASLPSLFRTLYYYDM